MTDIKEGSSITAQEFLQRLDSSTAGTLQGDTQALREFTTLYYKPDPEAKTLVDMIDIKPGELPFEGLSPRERWAGTLGLMFF